MLQDWGYETDAAWFDRLAEATPEGLDDRPGWIVSETADAAGGEGRTATSANVIGLPFQGVQPPKRAQSAAIRPRMLFELRARIQGPMLWLDPGAIIHSDPWPYLRGYDGDIGVMSHAPHPLSSATLLINDTAGAQGLSRPGLIGAERFETGDAALAALAMEHKLAGAEAQHVLQYLPPSRNTSTGEPSHTRQ